MSEPDNLVLILLREMRAEMATKADMTALKVELKADIADVRSEISSLRADVASDLMALEKRMDERFDHLNRSVTAYHSTVVGHGVLIGELEERQGRVEAHLKLPPGGKH
jgi:hypothetical protein